jgi:hypothetical protein
MGVEMAQRVFLSLFNDSTTEIPVVGDERFEDQLDSNGEIDISFACAYQGSVSYKGKLNSALQGNMTLKYSRCEQYGNGFALSGTMALSISNNTESSRDFTYYFDNLSWKIDEKLIKLSGYSQIVTELIANTFEYFFINDQQVLFTINDEQLLLDALLSVEEKGYETLFNLSGDLFMGDAGKVSFAIEDANGYPPYFSGGTMLLTGDKSSVFEFEGPYIRYVQDNDNDDIYDVGTYFADANELLFGLASSKPLVAIANLSLPTQVSSPSLNYSETLDTTNPIQVSEGYYSDPDTDYEDLTVSYRWFINSLVVNDQTSNTLPPYLAVYGDDVSVSMVVSDGTNVVVGPELYIYLDDAPAQISVSNLPNVIMPGEFVQFTAEVSDPDVNTTNAASSLISGPSGATIDADGLVTWNVPTEFLFAFQWYEFAFGLADANGDITDVMTVPLKVESDKAFPIVRSGVEVPIYNKSMSVGDFDGDGLNEVLSTNSIASVFLLKHDENSYQQKWVYPFKIPTDGNIIQVLAVNIDDDASQEILVVTERGVSVINGIDSIATVLFSTTDYMKFMAVEDINNDGVLELAYLHSADDYFYNDNVLLNVVSFDNPETSLFSTNLSSARQIEFANVDNDENLELVSNNGLVYDAVTWENQWFSGTQFGNSNVTTGDYNGDGVAEIVGADNWGNITVYSAIDKSQLDSFDNFNTCTLHSADLDADGSDELLVGDCQWGNITAYKIINNKLTTLWTVDMQDHGSVSLVSGDSDNDGVLEVHWGTGISHSGEDSFITADVDGDSVSIKQDPLSVQLDQYFSAGWSNIIDNEERAVFFIPSTQSGYGGSRIATMDENGNYELSEEISSNWDGSRYAVTTDFNNDGFGDIFLPSADTYDGSFTALQLYDNSIHWQTTGNYDSTIGVIKAKDLNGDGYDDAIYADGVVLNAIDIENQTIIANYTFDSFIRDFSPLKLNNAPAVLVAFGERLSFLTSNGSVFSEQSFIEQTCIRIILFNYDTDDQMELLCLQGDDYSFTPQELVIFELNDFKFTEIARNSVSSNIIDIAIDPSTEQQQNLFITTQNDDGYSYYDSSNQYQIKKSNPQGLTIWSSPSLIGQPSPHGLKVRYDSQIGLEMMLSTNSMMYWIK